MMLEFTKVTIVRQTKPSEKNLNKDLQWLSESLGLFNERDKERSCFRIFVELVKGARRKLLMSSDEIAARTNLSRGTVIHHINRLMESGLVVNYEGKYLMRVDNLEALVEELRKDLLRTLSDMQEIAEDLDEQLGLIKRVNNNSKVISD